MEELTVRLQFVKALPADKKTGRVPAEHYQIIEQKSGQEIGTIRLRLSNRDDILRYASHIGYGVHEARRGNHYATSACLALKPIAVAHGLRELWITCDPDNWPSRRTCERIGADPNQSKSSLAKSTPLILVTRWGVGHARWRFCDCFV